MDYFCYISRSKIDQLHENLSATTDDQWTEISNTENNMNLEGTADLNIASIVSLFKSGISYGRKGSIQREKQLKLHYTEKLRRVLLSITKESPIPLFDNCISKNDLSGFYFHTRNQFSLETPLEYECASDKIVNLISNINECQLVLDCSLKYFSDGNIPEKKFSVNSSNYRFFNSKMPYTFDTTFVLLGRDKSKFIGTPLYLKLTSGSILG